MVNGNFGEPSETPEHNRLRARFLDPWFCHALLWLIEPHWRELTDRLDAFLAERLAEAEAEEEKAAVEFCTRAVERKLSLDEQYLASAKTEEREARAELDEIAESLERNDRKAKWRVPLSRALARHESIRVVTYWLGWDARQWRAAADELSRWEAALTAAEKQQAQRSDPTSASPAPLQCSAEFEHGGWDVMIRGHLPDGPGAEAAIEIKPVLADDFPAVLRQIKARHNPSGTPPVLVLERFAADGASLDQVRQMFGGIPIITVAEIEAALVAIRDAAPARHIEEERP
jgi:hypothetical protein